MNLIPIVISPDINSFMQSADKASARANLDLGTLATQSGDFSAKADKSGAGVNFIVADVSADDATVNGANLLASYASAKLLTPNGASLSATNRAVLFVPPGRYDLGTVPLVMDTQFVDLVGSTGHPEHVLITSAVAVDNSGTLVQIANDVLISGVTLENTQTTNAINNTDADPAAYAPYDNLTLAKLRDVTMRGTGLGVSMRMVVYSGTFTNCTGGDYSFGGDSFSFSGGASGTFTNCTGGNSSFCDASGTFTNCTGGNSAFGGDTGDESGTFTNCTGGEYSFGINGASGTFINCTGGNSSFGNIGVASGTFINCTGGLDSYGGNAYGSGAGASGTFTNCTGGYGSYFEFTSTARLFFCRLTSGTFPSRSSGAKIKRSFEGDTEVNDA